MLIEAFGGIVKFNQKGATATVTGHITSPESCDVLKKGHVEYKEALIAIISAHKEFAQNISDSYQKEIQELENKLPSLNLCNFNFFYVSLTIYHTVFAFTNFLLFCFF